MSYTYVLTDIHGRYDLLEEALEVIPEEATIVMLGDYIDRGPDSAKVLSKLKLLKSSRPKTYLLMGNHEQMMVEALEASFNRHLWLINGGEETLLSYKGEMRSPKEDYHFISTLKLSYKDKHRIYVHAYADEDKKRNSFSKRDTLWVRYSREDMGWWNKLHVVHGHTPVNFPVLYSGRTNLDIGACHKGVLAIGVFDDNKAGGPVDILFVGTPKPKTKMRDVR